MSRRSQLEIGDRVVVRKCARRNNAHFSGSIPMVGKIISVGRHKAKVDCDGEVVERIIGQIEYCPSEQTIAQRAFALKFLALQKLRD